MDQNTQQGSAGPAGLTADGDALYDELMSAIEPELTTSQLPLLKEKYKDETPEHAAARAARYARAFAEYQKRFEACEESWRNDFMILTHEVRAAGERHERAFENDDMNGIADSIAQS